MSQATTEPTLPGRRSAIGFGLAATVAGLATPVLAGDPIPRTTPEAALTPIGALHGELRKQVDIYQQMDEALLEMSAGQAHDELEAAFHRQFRVILDLHDQITALPAQNLVDAAVQTTLAYYRASNIGSFSDDDETAADNSEIQRDLHMLLSSVVMSVVKAADLDIDSLGWGEMRRLCALWPAGRALA